MGKQEEEVAWREGEAEDSAEEEDEEEEDESEEEELWGCPNCGRLAHPQKRLLPSKTTQFCSNHSFLSLAFDVDSPAQRSLSHLPIEEHRCELMPQQEVSCCQHEVAGYHIPHTSCHMHRHCQSYHHQLLHKEAHGTRCIEGSREFQNQEC